MGSFIAGLYLGFHMFVRALLSKHLKKQEAKRTALQEQAVARLRTKSTNGIESGDSGRGADGFANASEAAADASPLTAQQAKDLRDSFRQDGSAISPWQILAWQFVAGLAVSLAVWLVTGKPNMAMSVAYGVIAVVLPAALFARGLMSQFSSLNAMTAGFGFFVWEALKIAVTIVLIALAPSLVANLDWLAMLIGLIVTMKVVWLILWMTRRLQASRHPQGLK